MFAQADGSFGAVAEQPVSPRAPRVLQFQFTGSAEEYFGIWIVNVALSIVTLGIYSAWAKVRTKRYFYRHTILDGSSFDYLGKPESVLKGRLIIGGLLGLTGLAAQFAPAANIVLSVVLFLLTPAFVVLGTAFNARNSSFRNVRFAFRGSIGEGYAQFGAALFVHLLSLGTAFPYLQWRITKFLAGRHVYGLEPFDFHAPAKAYFRAYLKAVGGALAILFVTVGPALAFFGKSDERQVFWGAVMSVGLLLAYLFAFAQIRTSLANLTLGSLTIGAHALESDQKLWDVMKLYLVNTLAIALSLGLLIPWAMIRMVKYRLSHLRLRQNGTLVTSNYELSTAVGALGDAAGDLGGLDFDLGF